MRYTLIILTIGLFSNLCSQVVFCPPGAEWHYLFNMNHFSPNPKFENETVKYIKDSVVNGSIVKVLSHKRSISAYDYHDVLRTVLKQTGDTVWFRNSITQNSWQILYNFAAQAGDKWVTTIYAPFLKTFTVTVSAVSATVVNGITLKVIDVSGLDYRASKITERIGGDGFIFPFKAGQTDGIGYSRALCYQDSTFGLLQYSSNPCDYSYIAGIQKVLPQNEIKIFAANEKLIIEHEGEIEVMILDLMGKQVYSSHLKPNEKQILLANVLSEGVYCAVVSQGNNPVTRVKLIVN
jgi:hypothetical protein